MPLDLNNQPQMGAPADLPSGEPDREGAMAKADLFKLANYAHKLYQQLDDGDQLEAWVQAKITKAADYIASVYHYLEYEMKFSEYGKALDDSDVLSESQRVALKSRLMEAKEKVKALKKAQAEKMDEGVLNGGEQPCAECGGTGVVHVPGRTVPEATKEKVRKYNTMVKATKAAHKRLDANKNGIPDEDEMEEGFEGGEKVGSTFKTSKGNTVTKTATGLRHERPASSYDDGGDDLDTMAKSGKGTKSHAKAKSASEKKAEAPKQKKSKSGTWGMEGGEKFDNRKKEESVDETYGQGVYEGKAKPDYIDLDKDGNKKETMKKAAKDKTNKVDEAAPSAGLSKEKKSAVVKKAKAGGDIGKPGKSFDKVAKAAGGGKKGEKIAAAAMWKNIKETTAYLEEKKKLADKDYDGDGKIETGSEEHAGSVDKAIKAAKAKKETNESVEMIRMREQMARLNQNENIIVKESNEVDQLRALTKLLG